MNSAATVRAQVERALSHHYCSPLQFRERPAPEAVSTGIGEIDAVTGGVPRGGLTKITGAASSGRTSLLLSILAEATARQEVCALVDAGNGFDPASAVQSAVNLERLLWIRCAGPGAQKNSSQKNLERALKVADMLLQSGGFGIVAMDLGNIAQEWVRRIPLASWFRFQRAVESTPTALLVLEAEAHAKSCAGLIIHLTREAPRMRPTAQTAAAAVVPRHAGILTGVEVCAEITGQQMRRKSAASISARFRVAAAWNCESKPPKRHAMDVECLLSA